MKTYINNSSKIGENKYQTVAVGGTFDRLHKGHQFLLDCAFQLGKYVLIGLTSDVFVREKMRTKYSRFDVSAQRYLERNKELQRFLKERGYFDRARIIEIDTVYGGLESRKDIDAIVVTRETRGGADAINILRKKNSLSEIFIQEVPLVAAEDEEKLSSTRIREGESDRDGMLYALRMKEGIVIQGALRSVLKKPQGTLFKGRLEDTVFWKKTFARDLQNTFVITVGDEVTKTFNLSTLPIHIAIFDYYIQRKKRFSSFRELFFSEEKKQYDVYTVLNPAGRIMPKLVDAVNDSIQRVIVTGKKQLINVRGEEDLAAVPAILLAPLGTKVVYGQPHEGVVVVDVTEKKKLQLLDMLKLHSYD